MTPVQVALLVQGNLDMDNYRENHEAQTSVEELVKAEVLAMLQFDAHYDGEVKTLDLANLFEVVDVSELRESDEVVVTAGVTIKGQFKVVTETIIEITVDDVNGDTEYSLRMTNSVEPPYMDMWFVAGSTIMRRVR